ncbi:MAG: hypothetical protein FJZ93_04780 [Chloroflexi bacterium]|nr:hypothetical protein [Chloroflexota bacterium]
MVESTFPLPDNSAVRGLGDRNRVREMLAQLSRDRNRVREMLAQLSKPLSTPKFPLLDELPGLTGLLAPLRRVVEIASEAFQLRYPAEEMARALRNVERVVREESLDAYPEGIELKRSAIQWLEEIEHIDPLNSQACLQVQLAPSLSVHEIEEERIDDGARRYVRLPISITNNGPGPALNVKVQFRPARGRIILDGPTTQDIGVLDCDGIQIVAFRFWQEGDEAISVEVLVTYYDFMSQSGQEKRELKVFEWPPLMVTVKGPIYNPFVIGRPVGSKSEFSTLFRDRDDQLRKLRQALGINVIINGKNQGKERTAPPPEPDSACEPASSLGAFVFVKGLRRTGRTSLLLQFREEIRDQRFLFVYTNCRDCEQQIGLNNSSWNQSDFLRAVANVVAATANAPLPKDRNVGEREDFKGFLQYMQDKVERRLFLVFDDADNLGIGPFAAFAEPVLAFFNRLAIEGISFVFVHELANGFWDKIERESAYEPIRVGFLKREETEALATEVLPTNLVYTPLAMRYLWLLTGGYPFLTQLVCHHLVEELNRRRDPMTGELNGVVEIGDLKRVVDQIILSEDDRPQIDYLSLGFEPKERSLLFQIGRSDDVDIQTGRVRPVKVVEKNGVTVLVRDRDECESDEEYKRFCSQYGTEETLHLFEALLTKEILDRNSDGVSIRNMCSDLRLRVGFLWLYLHSLQMTKHEGQGANNE